jgi:hypothetical protein
MRPPRPFEPLVAHQKRRHVASPWPSLPGKLLQIAPARGPSQRQLCPSVRPHRSLIASAVCSPASMAPASIWTSGDLERRGGSGLLQRVSLRVLRSAQRAARNTRRISSSSRYPGVTPERPRPGPKARPSPAWSKPPPPKSYGIDSRDCAKSHRSLPSRPMR